MKHSSFAQLEIEAASGLNLWRQFKTVSARLLNGGVLWPLKGQQGVLDDVHGCVDLRKPWASHWPFGAPDQRSSFQPQRAAIETPEGQIVEELLQPRDSFNGHSIETPWSRLQLLRGLCYVDLLEHALSLCVGRRRDPGDQTLERKWRDLETLKRHLPAGHHQPYRRPNILFQC